MDAFFRLAAILRKELIQLFSDPKSLFTLLVPPLMQILVLGYAATLDLKEVNFAVTDRDCSADSRALVAKFESNGIFRRRAPVASDAEMEARFASRDLKLVLVVPDGFSRELAAGETAPVQLLVDARNSNSAGTALVYANAVVEAFNAERSGNAAGAPRKISVSTRAWFNENFDARFFAVPAILAALALMDLLLVASLAIAKERDAGTLDQLLVTPVRTWEILLGKAAGVAFVGMLQLTGGLLLILFWFEIPLRGSVGLLYAMFASFVFTSAGLGTLISVCSKNLQRALMTAFFVIVPSVMLSGLIAPVENMPGFFRVVSAANPARYGVEAFQRIFLEGATFADMLPLLVALWVSGGAAFALAGAIFSLRSRE